MHEFVFFHIIISIVEALIYIYIYILGKLKFFRTVGFVVIL